MSMFNAQPEMEFNKRRYMYMYVGAHLRAKVICKSQYIMCKFCYDNREFQKEYRCGH